MANRRAADDMIRRGRRLADNVRAIFEPGDYQKVVRSGQIEWWFRPPFGGLVRGYETSDGEIVEHTDGTISLTSDIDVASSPGGSLTSFRLRKGVWRTR